ncbi:uncharacterized protein LOC117305621 [Asterias rubens]|uniref:uncharacterized protein LOC117305621 n=1 Tax=Asterias rubens TaxID=7604 RepID=UPI001455B839|nr:uncharacterized protein LOC117305621 [Asterias rubens]
MGRALSTIREGNMVGLSGDDEASLQKLVHDYFVDGSVESDDDSAEESEEEVEGAEALGDQGLPGDLEADVNFFPDQDGGDDDDDVDDDDGDDDDDPPVVNELQRVEHLLGEAAVAEDHDMEQQRAIDFSCDCSTFEGRPCIQQFTNEEVFKIRLDMQGLTEVDQQRQVKCLLKKYEMALTDLPGRCKFSELDIQLTTLDPVRSKPYPLPHALRNTVSEEIKAMLDMDVIERSNSPYASPIVLVSKKDGSQRFCIDFRRLNRVTVFDAEPMPDAEEIFSKLSGDKYFSKIDLSKGYWQIPLSEAGKRKDQFH